MAPAPADPAQVTMRQKLFALVTLSSTGTLVGLFSKFSQVSGKYKFSPASAVVCTEFFKLVISVTIMVRLLMKRELVDRTKTPFVPRGSGHQKKNATVAAIDSKTTDGEMATTTTTATTVVPVAADGGENDNTAGDERQTLILSSPSSSVSEPPTPIPTATPTYMDDINDFIRINYSTALIFHELGLAAAYCVVNIVTYSIFVHSSGSTFFLLKAASPVVTAIMLLAMVSRRISRPQWVAVILQCVGLWGTQINPCGATSVTSGVGYFLIFVNVAVSCAAGVWNEHIIKTFGTSVNFQNAFLYTFGVMINLCLFWFAPPWMTGAAADADALTFFEGYNLSVVGVIMANGSVGLVITMVYKYADVVVKTFGLAGSSITLFLLEVMGIIPGNRVIPLLTTLTGAAAVFYASYVYILPGKEFAPAGAVAAEAAAAAAAADGVAPLTTTAVVNIDGGKSSNSPSSPSSSAAALPIPPFDVLTLSWKAALANRRIKMLMAIGVGVIMSFLAAKMACDLGL